MYKYTPSFFNQISSGSYYSSKKIFESLKKTIQPLSLLDVGGGNGAWCKGFSDVFGSDDYILVDGDYVDINQLEVKNTHFHPHNLNNPLKLNRKFDLVICMEVGEHLEKRYAKTLVKSLTSHSDIILFSAAVPFQGGVNHVNEQAPEYWYNIFQEYGYNCCDILRQKIWNDENICWWYRQNLLIFFKGTTIFENTGKPNFLVHYYPWTQKSKSIYQKIKIRLLKTLKIDKCFLS